MSLGRGEIILLVEDEPTVLEATWAMLNHLGHQVVVATTGREALNRIRGDKDEIVLVSSDVVMPEMEGLALFNRLKVQNPDISVVLMSGYPLGEKGAAVPEQGVEGSGTKILKLPTPASICWSLNAMNMHQRVAVQATNCCLSAPFDIDFLCFGLLRILRLNGGYSVGLVGLNGPISISKSACGSHLKGGWV